MTTTKKHDFRTMSDLKCECGRPIKLNVAERKTKTHKLDCYKCHAKAQIKAGNRKFISRKLKAEYQDNVVKVQEQNLSKKEHINKYASK